MGPVSTSNISAEVTLKLSLDLKNCPKIMWWQHRSLWQVQVLVPRREHRARSWKEHRECQGDAAAHQPPESENPKLCLWSCPQIPLPRQPTPRRNNSLDSTAEAEGKVTASHAASCPHVPRPAARTRLHQQAPTTATQGPEFQAEYVGNIPTTL